ncbi:MAG: hemerythrin domain-containing protein [Polyangiaceae bacterium]
MNTGAYDVLSEHQHIRRMVDTLESAIEKRSLGGVEWLDEVRPVLIELAKGLPSHFSGEEAEFFGDVTRRLPRHAPTVERLVEQHRRLSIDFEKSASDATTLDATHTDVVDGFLTLLSKSLRLLRAHEEQENELMLVAYWQDLGESTD